MPHAIPQTHSSFYPHRVKLTILHHGNYTVVYLNSTRTVKVPDFTSVLRHVCAHTIIGKKNVNYIMSSANKEKNGLRKLREGFFGSLGLRALYTVLIIQN